MAKSFLERFARKLGQATGKVAERAREAGLDKKASAIIAKTKERLGDLVQEYEEGVEEQRDKEREDSASKAETEADAETTPSCSSEDDVESEVKSDVEPEAAPPGDDDSRRDPAGDGA